MILYCDHPVPCAKIKKANTFHKVWLCVLLAAVLLGVATLVVTGATESDSVDKLDFSTAVEAGFRVVVNQGVLNPQRTAPRLAYLSGLVFGLIIYATYSGNLTAFLSIPRLQKYPRSAQEMLDQGYAPILVKGYSQYDDFKYSPLEIYQKLFRLAESRGSIYPFQRIYYDVVLQRFAMGKVASIITSLGILYRQRDGAGPNERCAFFVEPNALENRMSRFILTKNSYFLAAFNKRLLLLRDTGALKGISQKHFAIPCISSNDADGSSRPLALTDLQGAFLLLVIGLLFATLIFSLEYFCARMFLTRAGRLQ